MEKVIKYKNVSRRLLAKLAARKNESSHTLNYRLIADELGGNYILLRNGWQGGTRLYGIIVHIEVMEDAKVWLQQDATDLIIADRLLEHGVAAKDLVLGFLAPAMRADMAMEDVQEMEMELQD